MSNAEILAQLPRLKPEERAQLLQKLCELQEQDLLHGAGPTEEEKKVLDEALAQFNLDGDPGAPWRQVLNEIRSSGAR